MPRIWDISVSLTKGMPVWPGDPPLVVEKFMDMERGDSGNVSRLSCGVHIGTHVDAPSHFVRNGLSVDQLALDNLVGCVQVFEFPESVRTIGARELESLAWDDGIQRVLFKTRNSAFWRNLQHPFQHDFTALTSEGARWLAARRSLKCVGIDYLSVQLFADSKPDTHIALLEKELVLIEGLNLSEVIPGRYQLVCLPVKLAGAEGAPARAILMEDSSR